MERQSGWGSALFLLELLILVWIDSLVYYTNILDGEETLSARPSSLNILWKDSLVGAHSSVPHELLIQE